MEEHDAWVILASVPGLGPATFRRLLRCHRSAAHVVMLAQTPAGRRRLRNEGPVLGGESADARGSAVPEGGWMSEAQAPGGRVPAEVIEALGQVVGRAEAVLAGLRESRTVALTLEDEAYPRLLREIEEPPPVLFVRGDLAALQGLAVAVVGTRRATEAGRRIAARIAAAVCRVEGCVVSGLAVGIDGAAHAAALSTGGRTVAVLGSGLDRLFPRVHGRLADTITANGGALVSEHPPDAVPTRGAFPRRNRVISGLSKATVVVEAGLGSGALITARWALEQGRDCFIVPGSIDAPESAGCLAFLRDYTGEARIVAGVAELIEDLALIRPPGPGASGASMGPTGRAGRVALMATLGSSEATIAGLIADGVATLDDIAAAASMPVAVVLATLTMLEMRGLVVEVYGRYRAAGRLATVPGGPTDLVAGR